MLHRKPILSLENRLLQTGAQGLKPLRTGVRPGRLPQKNKINAEKLPAPPKSS
jgi:hypothetical protein